MKTYIYPRNLSATPIQWLWSLPAVAGIALLGVVSVFSALYFRLWIPLYITVAFAVMTIRVGENTILKMLKHSIRFFLGKQIYGGTR